MADSDSDYVYKQYILDIFDNIFAKYDTRSNPFHVTGIFLYPLKISEN